MSWLPGAVIVTPCTWVFGSFFAGAEAGAVVVWARAAVLVLRAARPVAARRAARRVGKVMDGLLCRGDHATTTRNVAVLAVTPFR
jgi:hypothetical protein